MLRTLLNNFTARKNPAIPHADIKTSRDGSALLRADAINRGPAQMFEKATAVKFEIIFDTKKLCAVTLNAVQKNPRDSKSLGAMYLMPQIM
jgi:hypothetical protein